MSKRRKDLSASVIIDGYSAKGNGVGVARTEEGREFPVEVPFTMPGDTAKVLVGRRRRGLAQSQLQELTVAAPERCAPRCEHFGDCGGCRWQHLSDDEQLKQKELWLNQLFSPFCDFDALIRPILPCPSQWRYRNKMEFSFSQNAAGDRYLGLMKAVGRQKVVSLKECHLVHPWFIEAIAVTRSWWEAAGVDAYHAYRDLGSLRTLTVREGYHTGDRLLILTVSGNPEAAISEELLDHLVSMWQKALTPTQPSATLSLLLRTQIIAKGQPTRFVERCLAGPGFLREKLHIALADGRERMLECKVSPEAFFQPNTRQAERLYASAVDLADLSFEDTVYDLYCGTGTLGLVAAPFVKKVIGIELVADAIRDAKENAKANGIDHAEFLCGDAAQVLRDLAEDVSCTPDVVFVDPPRAGLGPHALEQLRQLAAPKLVYVSCNPKTQAADIQELLSFGYRLDLLQPVDQFPHTVHLETIAILRR